MTREHRRSLRRTPESPRRNERVRATVRLGAATVRAGAIAMLTAVALMAGTAAFAQETPSAAELISAAETSVFPERFEARLTLTTREDDDVTSRMELAIAYRDGAGSYIEVLAPERSRGLRFLQTDDRLWMYNPRAGGDQAIRLSPRAVFQGSAFSNRDLTDLGFADDYDVSVRETETIDHPDLGAVESWVLEATARNDQISYARILMWITVNDRILVRSEYYAKSDLLVKQARLERIRELAGRRRPTVMHMSSAQRGSLASTMEIEALTPRPDLSEQIFTQEYLTRPGEEER
ncbi:MAG: outer membrane lipoprotein-sorting protein [Spirochaetota bacterium]